MFEHLRGKDALDNLKSSLNDLPAAVPAPVMLLTMMTMMVGVLLEKNDDEDGGRSGCNGDVDGVTFQGHSRTWLGGGFLVDPGRRRTQSRSVWPTTLRCQEGWSENDYCTYHFQPSSSSLY